MVSRGYFGVSDNDGRTHGSVAPKGSEVIQQLYLDWFAAEGLETTAAILTNGSDYASFWQVLNKPFGFLNTGTGVEQDDCYHQACDTIENPDEFVITNNAKVSCPLKRLPDVCMYVHVLMISRLLLTWFPCSPPRATSSSPRSSSRSLTWRPSGLPILALALWTLLSLRRSARGISAVATICK